MDNERRGRLTELLEAMVETVVDEAPDGWERARATCFANQFRAGGRLVYDDAGDAAAARPGGSIVDLFEPTPFSGHLSRLIELTKGPGAGLDVELTVRPSGAFDATVTPRSKRGMFSSGEGQGISLGSFEPTATGASQEGPLDDTEAGDPAKAVRLLREYLRRCGRLLGREPTVTVHTPDSNPPAPDEDTEALLAELERHVGRRLPADLRALYGVTGKDADPDAFYNWIWLPLDELLADDQAHLNHNEYEPDDASDTIFDADPPETVRRLTGHPGWIPFAHDDAGNYLVADMAPTLNGRPGQIVATGTDFSNGPMYVAASITELLRRQLDALDTGQYEVEPDSGPACGDGYLELLGHEWGAMTGSGARWLTTTGGTLDGVPADLQQLTVRCGGRLRLEVLRPTFRLRWVWLECEAVDDLEPLRDLPLEELRLDISAGRIDLAPLAGHPTLRRLRLSAGRQRIDIAPLVTMPELHTVDLAKTDVVDLAPLAAVPGLRALSLRHEQWRALRDRQDPIVLPGLAVATLSDAGGFPSGDTMRWADEFPSRPAPPLVRRSGTIAPQRA